MQRSPRVFAAGNLQASADAQRVPGKENLRHSRAIARRIGHIEVGVE